MARALSEVPEFFGSRGHVQLERAAGLLAPKPPPLLRDRLEELQANRRGYCLQPLIVLLILILLTQHKENYSRKTMVRIPL